ncbi:major facilitator superfamily domain-containing protein [Dendryphion nanum]|uniref:Major facilitator superfamily domain-containing protein n=1 Tax=Dendryphion nanum TaxID=256645 RepID=A0A9P9INK4_9PLEO|nr:major facilitator superfamily domain-containing protein [Dendryphion nanum]
MASSNRNTSIIADAITAAPSRDVELQPIPVLTQKSDDPFLVAFNPNFDIDNPKDWPTGRKWAVTDVLSATGFTRIMVSTIMAPALSIIASELHMSSTEAAMSLSIYLLATAFGPLFLGPLSEVYGRERVLHASNVWFLIWNITCGFANTKELLIGARFLAGLGASAIYSLSGGVLSDVWRPDQRGRSLSIYLLIPLLGAAVGPIIGGFMAGRTTWRWMFWSTSIFQAVIILVSMSAFHETYAPLILRRRAEKLRRETGNNQYYTIHERFDSKRSTVGLLTRALTRPLRLLMFHPIIQITTMIEAFFYGLLYIILSSFSELWVRQYGYSVEISGLHYIANASGEVVGSQISGRIMDYLYRRMKARNDAATDLEPEKRIPLSFPGRLLIPAGLLIYGWTAQYHVHWAAVDLGIFLTSLGMSVAGLPLSAYVIDAYPDHTSSALAASQFLRSLTAFLFPLFTPALYNALGYGWGNSTIAFVSLIFGIPAPWLLFKFGARLRARAVSSD